jgi:cysteine dioxygenase
MINHRNYDASNNEWRKFAFFDDDKLYTRNLVATDNETFTLLILCWNPHKSSPIHDHPCDGCWMRVIDNTVNEQQFKISETDSHEFIKTGETDFLSGQCAFIDDGIGFHKVANNTDLPSVTMHLYSPPFQSCRAWTDVKDAEKVCRPQITMYSMNGKKVDYV